MLQQTQVARVVPRYHAFLDRFPTPAACAAGDRRPRSSPCGRASGYNRRAVNLHRCAVAVVERARWSAAPDRLDALLALPGIGPYTARAVLAFAFEARRRAWSTPTRPGCWPAPAGRSLGRREAQAAGRRRGAAGRGLGLEPGHARPRRARSARPRSPALRRVPGARRRARGRTATATPSPDPADGSAGVSGGQSPLRGIRPPGPGSAGRRPAASGESAVGRRRRRLARGPGAGDRVADARGTAWPCERADGHAW